MKVDAHQHFWRYNEDEYGWIGEEMAALRHDFMPSDLEPLQKDLQISGTVAVQARSTLEETHWLLQLAEENDFVRGVVGWVDLCDPDLDIVLERLGRFPAFCGVRHGIQDEPGNPFLEREDLLRGVGMLSEFDLAFDLLVRPRHLPVTCEFVERFPYQRFVLDHMAKPPIATSEIDSWAEDLRRLAAYDNVYCKVSGMVTEAKWNEWTADDFRPYLDVVFQAFSTQRIMLGSDWPVCTVAASYAEVMNLAYDYVSQFSIAEQADVCSGNAWRCYRLGR